MHQSNRGIFCSQELERWPLEFPARITGYVFTAIEVLVVTLRDGDFEHWHNSPAQRRNLAIMRCDDLVVGLERNLPPAKTRKNARPIQTFSAPR